MTNGINLNFRPFTAQVGKMGTTAGAALEKIGQKTGGFFSKLPARVENLAKKIENFDSGKLSKMLDKLDTKLNKLDPQTIDKAINTLQKAKNSATSMFNKLDKLMGGKLTGSLKKSSGGSLDDLKKELGKDLNELRKEVKSFNSVNSEFRTHYQPVATPILYPPVAIRTFTAIENFDSGKLSKMLDNLEKKLDNLEKKLDNLDAKTIDKASDNVLQKVKDLATSMFNKLDKLMGEKLTSSSNPSSGSLDGLKEEPGNGLNEPQKGAEKLKKE